MHLYSIHTSANDNLLLTKTHSVTRIIMFILPIHNPVVITNGYIINNSFQTYTRMSAHVYRVLN